MREDTSAEWSEWLVVMVEPRLCPSPVSRCKSDWRSGGRDQVCADHGFRNAAAAA